MFGVELSQLDLNGDQGAPYGIVTIPSFRLQTLYKLCEIEGDDAWAEGTAEMDIEQRLRDKNIELPNLSGCNYYGLNYGPMKSHHIVGNVLFLSGQVPIIDGNILHPGRIGGAVTPEEGYAAARLTGLNMIATMKDALGDLNRVKGLIRCLCFVACVPGFTDVHKVSTGCSDILIEVFGDDVGRAGRATIGIQSLCDNLCFETWSEVEIVS